MLINAVSKLIISSIWIINGNIGLRNAVSIVCRQQEAGSVGILMMYNSTNELGLFQIELITSKSIISPVAAYHDISSQNSWQYFVNYNKNGDVYINMERETNITSIFSVYLSLFLSSFIFLFSFVSLRSLCHTLKLINILY